MKKTNFDLYLEEQLKDPTFAECFQMADEAWDTAIQIAAPPDVRSPRAARRK